MSAPLRFEFEAKDRLFDVAQIRSFSNLAETAFGKYGFTGFSPRKQQTASIAISGKLAPDLFKGLAITNFLVSAEIPSKSFGFELLAGILNSGRALLGEKGPGMIGVDVSFVEKTSNEKRDGSEVGVEYRDGEIYFCISGPFRGPKSDSNGPEAAGKHVAEMIQTAGLPLKVDFQNDAFFLSATEDARLVVMSSKVHQSRREANPLDFKCTVAGQTPEELVEKMKRVWQEFGRPDSFKPGWSALGSLKGPAELNQKAFESIIALDLPAKKTQLTLFYTLQNLDGIEAMKQLVGKKGSSSIDFCAFNLPDDEGVKLTVDTTAKGHALSGSISSVDSFPLVEAALGVKLTCTNLD